MPKIKLQSCLILLFFAAPIITHADVYKSIDKDGNITFTDQPNSINKKIKIKKRLSTYSPKLPTQKKLNTSSKISADKTKSKLDKIKKFPGYKSIALAAPQNDATIWSDENKLNCSIALSPPLQKGHKVIVYVDGKPTKPTSSTSISVNNIYRGEHTVYAKVIDDKGKTLKKTNSVTVHVKQHSSISN